MNAIELMIFLFLSLSDPCDATTLEAVHIGQQDYIAITYVCGEKVFIVWRLQCPNRENVFGRPFYLQEMNNGYAFYVNKFGEVQVGYRVRLDKMLTYGCGT